MAPTDAADRHLEELDDAALVTHVVARRP